MIRFVAHFDTACDYTLHIHKHKCPQSRLHCRCLVAATNGGRSPSSGFVNCPRPQLPASNSNSSQQPLPSVIPTLMPPILYCLTAYVLKICLYIHGSTALVDPSCLFSFLIYTKLVGLLGGEISPSHGRYLYTGQHRHKINAHRHQCVEWDSNPLSQCLSGRRWFVP
jgi:hypothetical protein